MDDLAVAVACDQAYVPWALCLLEEVGRRHPDLPLVLASEAPLDLPLELPSLRTVVVENPFRGALPESRHGMAAYLRLVLPDRLAGEARRVLYLDCDTWPLGDLTDAARVDLRGRPLGAVRDNQQWRTPTRRLAEHRALGRPAVPYLNSGVLLVDTEAWTRADVLARLLAALRDRPGAMTRHDQSLLNIALEGEWAEMSPVWNWQVTDKSRLFLEAAAPRLLHFIGPRKPWTGRSALWRRPYVDFARRHGLDLAIPEPPRWPEGLRSTLFQHWRSEERMHRYLGRFPDDLSTA
jgi:lipopolysaccharide biosynthesis glycosyltransferase